MEKRIRGFVLVSAIFFLSGFIYQSVVWSIDPGYTIKFSGTRAEGIFSGFKGVVIFDPNDLQHARMDVEVDAASIKTGNSTKDSHARGESWLDVAHYPKITFRSSSFSKAVNGYVVNGALNLHGITKNIMIPFQFSRANGKGIFTGSVIIQRKDFGINGNFFGFSVGKEFTIDLKVPVSTLHGL